MSFYVYVLHSAATDKIYIGFTSDLDHRLKAHNELAIKGWTIKFRPWILIYAETFQTKSEALKREREFKSSRGRDFIRKNILSR
jgi:putative endonuclease